MPVTKAGSGFTTSYVLLIFVHSELRWEAIVRFVDIGVIVDHHCLHWSVKWSLNQWIILKKSLCNIHKNAPPFCFIFNELEVNATTDTDTNISYCFLSRFIMNVVSIFQ